ncbi:hypothetical protein MLD52_07205 [Puniceicoccaceae bacterium K14]|nr:hypothetical protein [Puniceicoccaceae bacterium K14]
MKKYNNILRLVVGFLVLGSSILVHADHHDEKKEKSSGTPQAHSKEGFMMKYDSDGDGVVSEAEFLEAREISHKEKDLDGDGIVTEAEYVAEWETRLDKELAERREASVKQAYVRYGVLDKDKNQNMTVEEFHVSGNRTFKHYDTDGDGIVTEDDTKPENRFGDLAQNESKKDKKSKKKKKKKKKAKKNKES